MTHLLFSQVLLSIHDLSLDLRKLGGVASAHGVNDAVVSHKPKRIHCVDITRSIIQLDGYVNKLGESFGLFGGRKRAGTQQKAVLCNAQGQALALDLLRALLGHGWGLRC